ncbi:branched-chain amino acid ABC transporter permease [Gordonia sp. NPDC058843]|uniref:branched-chain amino acid ABC transporter permease n=1 Tax=Gordonia sp. NPDC058843 TaxID=3346648 RepID=UPI00367F0EB4
MMPTTKSSTAQSSPAQTPTPEASAQTNGRRLPRPRHLLGGVLIGIAVIVTLLVPLFNVSLGGLLPGPLNSPGSMNLLALMLVAAATAITLDLVFGYTGLLSLGHGVYFGVGCYAAVMFGNMESVGFGLGVLLALATTLLVSIVGNACALKLTGFGFAMATLALVQLFAICVERGYWGLGGEVGVTYDFGVLPANFTGLVNARNVYWLAVATLVVVYVVARLIVATEAGSVWQAIRENALRAEVLGINVYLYRLFAATTGSFLAGLCGIAYSVVMGGGNPGIVALTYSLGLILMVVLGGRGLLWGALLGGLLYTYLNLRLSALSTLPAIQDLPAVLSVPLTQPQFILGVIFVLVILFLPGGLASAITGRRRRSDAAAS